MRASVTVVIWSLKKKKTLKRHGEDEFSLSTFNSVNYNDKSFISISVPRFFFPVVWLNCLEKEMLADK